MHSSRLFALFLMFMVHLGAWAEDFGTVGPTFQTDPDGREQLRAEMRKKQQDGELTQFWKNYRQKVIDSILNPPSLGIPSDRTHQVLYSPVEFTIPADWHDQNGHVVAHKGEVIHPLRIHPLTAGLIFIDGRDAQQVAYAIHQAQVQPLKIVLTAGSYYRLREQYKQVRWSGGFGIPFYYDQKKMIINSLRRLYGICIDRVPVQLTQVRDELKIEYGYPE